IPLLKGRMFAESDGPDAPHVALISESVARQKWPNEDPIGRTIEFGNMDADLRLLTIVGVVGEVRKHSLEGAPHPTVYVNYRQRSRSADEFDVVLRTNSDPEAMFPVIRRVLTQLDATVPAKIGTLNQTFSASLNNRRFNLLLVGVFALTALLLAMAGVFGVLAYSVVQRTQEIGVRMALGARTLHVMRLVFGQSLGMLLIGIVVGLVGAFALTRLMRTLLFEITATDPLTYISVIGLLTFVALLACYIPARRAAKVDPLIALRYE
ncbi:MAG TPA: FtsX-like permease family protein, partial [Pyrinomonadaceae bacterium]|nr:FtsX-like permease family protein [Pyrinomonadaceae bacterium]